MPGIIVRDALDRLLNNCSFQNGVDLGAEAMMTKTSYARASTRIVARSVAKVTFYKSINYLDNFW
jgi:hypothetical protein